MSMKGPFCQSCGMPMHGKEDFGTNADSTKNNEYCCYCFKEGKFLDEGITMEQKIQKNIELAKEMGIPEKRAKEFAYSVIPKLKRWRKE